MALTVPHDDASQPVTVGGTTYDKIALGSMLISFNKGVAGVVPKVKCVFRRYKTGPLEAAPRHTQKVLQAEWDDADVEGVPGLEAAVQAALNAVFQVAQDRGKI